jgi:hypothetical protein
MAPEVASNWVVLVRPEGNRSETEMEEVAAWGSFDQPV